MQVICVTHNMHTMLNTYMGHMKRLMCYIISKYGCQLVHSIKEHIDSQE